MKLKKIISAAVGTAVICSSLPFSSTTVDFVRDNALKANAVNKPYSELEYPSESYYYGSKGVTLENTSEKYYEEDSSEVPDETRVWETTSRITTTNTVNYTIDTSDISSDSPYAYFFSMERNFYKLTNNLQFIGNKPQNISYKYNDKAVEGPCDVFVKGTHIYELTVIADGVIAGTVTVYIGVKGDANLDDEVNSKDAVAVLDAYADMLVGKEPHIYGNNLFEKLTMYLVDIDTEQFDFNNINSKDAMYILQFYASEIAERNPLWSTICKDLAGKTYSLDNSSYIDDNNNFQVNSEDSSTKTIIEIENVSVKPGTKTVSVPVTISGNVGFACYGLIFRYDPYLTFESCKKGVLYKPETSTNNNLLATTFASFKNRSENRTLFTIEFKLPDNTKDGDVFNITGNNDTFYDEYGKDLPIKIKCGAINISSDAEPTTEPNLDVEPTTEPNLDVEPTFVECKNIIYKHSDDNETVVEIGNIEVSKEDAGKAVKVPVSIFNNPGFQGTAIGYTYDKRIKCLSVTECLIANLATASGTNYEAVTSARSSDISGDGVLYYLNFKLPKTLKVGDVFDILAEIHMFANANGEDVDTKIYGGSISIIDDTSSSTEPTTEEPSETETSTSSKNNLYGDVNVDDDVTIADAVLLNKYLVDSATLSEQEMILYNKT